VTDGVNCWVINVRNDHETTLEEFARLITKPVHNVAAIVLIVRRELP